MTAPQPRVNQMCYLVKDADQAALRWAKLLRAGPFYKSRALVPGYLYRGQITTLDVTTAIGFIGDLQIELMQLNNNDPSVFREGWDARGEGLHHLLIHSEDFSADCARYESEGCPVVQYKDFPGYGRNAFVDTSEQLGYYVQLHESNPASRRLTEFQRAAHASWDGIDPIRPSPTFED